MKSCSSIGNIKLWFIKAIIAILAGVFMSFLLDYKGIIGLSFFTILTFIIASEINLSNLGIRVKGCDVFLYSLLLSYLIFLLGWQWDLSISSADDGYDPARFYHMAKDSTEGKSEIFSFNYVGIVYLYKLIFSFFGINPLMCICLNVLFTYISAFSISKVFLLLVGDKCRERDCKRLFILVMFMPEIIWYDCLSSREIVCMMCVTSSIYLILDLFLNKASLTKIIYLFSTILLLGVVRTTLLLMIVVLFSIIFYFYGNRTNNKLMALSSFLLIGIALVLAPIISHLMGSYDFSFANQVQDTMSSDKDVSEENWSANSIGVMLVANSFQEMIYLAPFRIITYIVTPFPLIWIDFAELFRPVYSAWQHLAALLSSIFYLINIPYLLNSIRSSLKNRRSFFLSMLFLSVFFTISCGVNIIQERYRLTGIPLLLLVAVYGKGLHSYTKKSRSICIIFGLVAFTFYLMIKF